MATGSALEVPAGQLVGCPLVLATPIHAWSCSAVCMHVLLNKGKWNDSLLVTLVTKRKDSGLVWSQVFADFVDPRR